MNQLLIRFCLLTAVALLALRSSQAAGSQNHPNRSQALHAICQRLNIGPGAVIADVGCGNGSDSMVFAGIVGEGGAVLAQEINADNLKKVVENAAKKGLHQVTPVLGQSDDPRLPDGLADLLYMNRVFHHFSQPQPMLARMRADLKPGGYLVIVDQQKGPLTDWTSMENREKQHHWTGETTVVRLAREAGFFFHDVLDDLWHESQPFVLVFRKPSEPRASRGDPDLPLPLDAEAVISGLPLPGDGSSVLFCGLDQGRVVLSALKEKLPASVPCFDLVIEEWALSRQELPSGTPQPGIEVLRTEKGSLVVPEAVRLGLVLFVDSYHRLWNPPPLLQALKQRLTSSTQIAVIDQAGPDAESRRLAGHRRRISPKEVIQEMNQAGFRLRQTLPAPAPDRFFLLFGSDTP